LKNKTIGFGNTEVDQYTLEAAKILNDKLPIKKIICAHVEPKFDVWDSLYLKELKKLASERQEQNEIKKEIEKAMSFCLNGKISKQTEIIMKHGKVAHELLDVLEENKADLLILGQQEVRAGHGILIRNLIRLAAANVMVVPKVTVKELKTILVAIDFSKCTENLMKTASEIATAMKGDVNIKLMHVFSEPFYANDRNPIGLNNYMRETSSKVGIAFKELTNKSEFPKNCQPEFIELTSEPDKFQEAIIQTAKNEHADLLIVGNQGHSPCKQFYLGSVAEKMTMIDLPCPTLFVKCI